MDAEMPGFEPTCAVFAAWRANDLVLYSTLLHHAWMLGLNPEGACTDDLLSRKPGFLLSALHSHTFRWLSATPLVFLFLGFLPL